MDVLKKSLQRMGTLTHLSLLTRAVHEASDYNGYTDRGSILQVPSSRELPRLRHPAATAECRDASLHHLQYCSQGASWLLQEAAAG